MPSFDEGLAFSEALKFNKHVISRNIPIFREVMQEQGIIFQIQMKEKLLNF